MAEDMTEEQAENLLRDLAQGKESNTRFFTNVIKSKDTTKTGNLDETELGQGSLPLRSSKELELFCEDVWNQPSWATYFKKLSEINTSTSLSKEAILLKLAVTKKSEVADLTPKTKKPNKGWFKSKKE